MEWAFASTIMNDSNSLDNSRLTPDKYSSARSPDTATDKDRPFRWLTHVIDARGNYLSAAVVGPSSWCHAIQQNLRVHGHRPKRITIFIFVFLLFHNWNLVSFEWLTSQERFKFQVIFFPSRRPHCLYWWCRFIKFHRPRNWLIMAENIFNEKNPMIWSNSYCNRALSSFAHPHTLHIIMLHCWSIHFE